MHYVKVLHLWVSLCFARHFIPQAPQDFAVIFHSLISTRGDPWPVNADCTTFDSWIARRKALKAGSLQKLTDFQHMRQSLAENGTYENVSTLTAEEIECVLSLTGAKGISSVLRFDSICFSLQDFMTTRIKLKHDMDQLAYLLVKGRLPPCFYRVLEAFIRAHTTLYTDGQSHNRMIMSGQTFNDIGLFYDTFLYMPKTPILTKVLSPTFDFALARQTYYSSSPHFTVADNFLTPEAVDALYTLAQEATVWFDKKKSYVGAYVHQGLANVVLLQLVEEIRKGFPDIVGDLELIDLWAYKYEQGSAGISKHSDGALVNLNIWVTPDAANNNETSGGMVVYLKEPPPDVDNEKFNRISDMTERDAFTKDAPFVSVPYRCNRVVIFKSSLVHYTDEHDFKPGYDSRRINYTLLFGRLPNFYVTK